MAFFKIEAMEGNLVSEQEYVLGTHDEEIARLGLQHQAWRERVQAAWQAAEFGPGQTILDVGCGPGYAALDLAELVGPTGSVVAIDRSENFLTALRNAVRQFGLKQITIHHADLDADEFADSHADAAWLRWVLAFVKKPRHALEQVAGALKPAGTIVLHEYFDYATWRALPHLPELGEFVSAVMASWRDNGGEPDIALSIPNWIEEMGFEIAGLHPILDVVHPGDKRWAWLRTFVDVGRRRLADLGYWSPGRAEAIWRAFNDFESAPHGRMITPGVMEIIATRVAGNSGKV